MGMKIVICQHQKECLFTKYFFLLLVTPDIPPVSGNNDAIKRLSSVKYFSSKELQEGDSLCPHEKYCIATVIKTDKCQLKKLSIYVALTQASKLGLHPAMLLSSAQIIELIKITIKMKTGLLMCLCFLFHLYLYVLFSYKLTSSLNLADLPFFIYNTSHNNFFNYFLCEYAIWNAEF